jgi:hypothetical protein
MIAVVPKTVIKGAGGFLEYTIYDGTTVNPPPLDLTGASAIFYCVCKEDPTKKFYGNMTVVNATLGQVNYEILTTDFPEVGTYEGEIVLDYGDPLPIKAKGIIINCVASLVDSFTPEGV